MTPAQFGAKIANAGNIPAVGPSTLPSPNRPSSITRAFPEQPHGPAQVPQAAALAGPPVKLPAAPGGSNPVQQPPAAKVAGAYSFGTEIAKKVGNRVQTLRERTAKGSGMRAAMSHAC